MKQTVEEAARENILFNHRTVDRTLIGKDLAKFGEMNFVQGAEWQSKQSPWISVKERLPEPNKLVLCRMVSNGAIVSGYIVVSSGRSPYVATDGGSHPAWVCGLKHRIASKRGGRFRHTLRGCIWIEALFTRWSSLWKNCKHSASCVFLFKLL